MNEIKTADAVSHELIAFRVADQEFCVNIMAVCEIRGWTEATPLPRAPRSVRGVINLRGAVLPIVDFAARIGLASTDPTARHVVIVTQVNHQQVGLLVDAVSDILTVSEEAIQRTPDIASAVVKEFVQGLLPIDGRMISLISLTNILQTEEVLAA